MADLKKLALGRKGIQKAAQADAKAKKPAKSLEETSAEEVGELEEAFRSRLAREDRRRKSATDSESYLCIYFGNRQEKDRFLRKFGLDKLGDKYLAGGMVDRVLDRRTRAKDGHSKER